MNILITVNHSFTSLTPICADEPVSILPIAGKALLEHVLEAVVELDASQITIAASGNVVGLRHLISDGERWGLAINIVSAQTNEIAEDIYRRCSNLHQRDTLIVPCDRLYVSRFVDIVSALEAELGSGSGLVSKELGVTYLVANPDLASIVEISTPGLSVHKIHTPVDFHAASLAALSGTLGPLKLRGKQAAVGLKQGYMTRFHPRCVQSGHVFVGNHCRVHPTCKFTGPVVINHGASIDRMTCVENSVILDNSIIGEHLSVTNAIVSGSTIIRVDTGAVIDLSDKFLLSERGDSFFSEYGRAPLNRLVGLLITTLTLPVLMLAIAGQFLRASGPVFQRCTFVGNKVDTATSERSVFTTYVINDPDSPFRRLPMLLSVIAGEINLFGVSPLTAEESANCVDGWQKVSDEALVGLIGPTQLYVGMDAPLDERLLSDAMSSQTKIGMSGWIELLVNCIQFPFVRTVDSTR